MAPAWSSRASCDPTQCRAHRPPWPTSWDCATWPSRSTTCRRLSIGQLPRAMDWSVASASTRALGGWPTSGDRKGSSSRWPSASAEPRTAHTWGLLAECGPGCGCGGGVVPGWFDEAPLVEGAAVGEGAPVAETGEVERPDVHDCLEPGEFVVGWLDVLVVGVDGGVYPLLVRAARVPRAGAPQQVSEVGEAGSAPGRFPVDRDRPLVAQDGVIGGVEEISVEQAFRKTVAVVGRADLVAEVLEPLAPGGRDLGVDGVEKRQGRQQVLTRRALMSGVLTTRSTRAARGFVVRQRVQPSEQLTHHGELRGTIGERDAFNEPRHEDRAAIEVRYRIVDGQALRGIVLPLQEPEKIGR